MLFVGKKQEDHLNPLFFHYQLRLPLRGSARGTCQDCRAPDDVGQSNVRIEDGERYAARLLLRQQLSEAGNLRAAAARVGAVHPELRVQLDGGQHPADHLRVEQSRARGALHGDQHDQVRRA